MTSKKVRLEEEFPETYKFAQEVVGKVKRELSKKHSVTKIASELVQPLNAFKDK
jgi:hypothetical protein